MQQSSTLCAGPMITIHRATVSPDYEMVTLPTDGMSTPAWRKENTYTHLEILYHIHSTTNFKISTRETAGDLVAIKLLACD